MQYEEVIGTPPDVGNKQGVEVIFPPHGIRQSRADVSVQPRLDRRRVEVQPGTEFPLTVGRAHLVGIAGAGMRSLAHVLLAWGWQLSGSDRAPESLTHLTAAGVQVHPGHAADHLATRPDLVIYSDAIPAGNPELVEARRLGVPVLSYFQTLGRMMVGKRGLAIAGTHGKSTTTAMLAHLLDGAGLDPTAVFGAVPQGRLGGAMAGRGPLMLVEACEYRANFLHLPAQQAAILGIEPDHFDCYRSPDELLRAFAQFASRVPKKGLLLARYECSSTRRVAAGLRCRVETFGLDHQADWSARELRADHGRYCFGLFHRQERVGRVSLQVPGRHNVLNALAAAALAWENGLQAEQIAAGLGQFPGLHRRLEPLGTWRGVILLDDYAHHPTEIAATLATVREMHPGRRVWCVFQPHQVSRTEHLLDELAASLQNADRVAVAEIFRAREPGPQPGEVCAADLAARARQGGVEVAEHHATGAIVRWLQTHLQPGDVFITMGAGDIRKIHELWKG